MRFPHTFDTIIIIMKEKPFASENSFNYFGLIMKNAVYPLTFRMKFFLTHKLMAQAYISPAQNRIFFASPLGEIGFSMKPKPAMRYMLS